MNYLTSLYLALFLLGGATFNAFSIEMGYNEIARRQVMLHLMEIDIVLERLEKAIEDGNIQVSDEKPAVEYLTKARLMTETILKKEGMALENFSQDPSLMHVSTAFKEALEAQAQSNSTVSVETFKLVHQYVETLSDFLAIQEMYALEQLEQQLMIPTSELLQVVSKYIGVTLALLTSMLKEQERRNIINQVQMLNLVLESLQQALAKEEILVSKKEEVSSYLMFIRTALSWVLANEPIDANQNQWKAQAEQAVAAISADWKNPIINVVTHAVIKEFIRQNTTISVDKVNESAIDATMLVGRSLQEGEAAVFKLSNGLSRNYFALAK